MNNEITVIRSYQAWLPQPQTWRRSQGKYLSTTAESHIVCETTQNLDQFTVRNAHSLHQAACWRHYWDKGLHREVYQWLRYWKRVPQKIHRQEVDPLQLKRAKP